MKLSLTVVILISFLEVVAQDITQLQHALDNATTDSLKISAFRNIVNHYKFSHGDSALFYAKEGVAFARQQQYRPGEGLMIYCTGQVNERHGNLEQAKNQYQQAKTIFQELNDVKGIASTTNGLGIIAGRTGKYDEATRYFLEALALFEQVGHNEGVVQTYIKLGVVNDHLGNLDQALTYYLKAENLNSVPEGSNASLTLFNNIGIIYGKRGDLATALKYFHKGLRASDAEKNTGVHIALLGSLGLAYEKSGRPDSAWHFQQSALSLAKKNNLPEEEARALVNLASLVQKDDPDQSLALLADALVITQRIQQPGLMADVYESMIDLYKGRNDYKVAMELAEKRQVLMDSLFSLEKSREIANLHANQELTRQENEIRDLALRNEKSEFQRNVMFTVAIIAIVMICIVWFYKTRLSKLNTELVRKQKELKNSNNIKDKLFSVLGHDLRTPMNQVIGLLNLLSLQHRGQEESPIIEKLRQQSQHTLETLDNLLMWGQSQLKGVRLNQQTLHAKEQVRKTIFLTGDYAAQKNVDIVDNISPDIHIYADPSHFDFVIRNLLSNAIKFSHAGGKVSIGAKFLGDKQVVFSINDSGVGIAAAHQRKIFTAGNESAKGTWNEKGTGIGLMLCREYIAENGGKMWVESKEGRGSTFYFSLKKNVSKPQNELAGQTI